MAEPAVMGVFGFDDAHDIALIDAALATLPNTPRGIARLFARLGIKGVPAMASDCPLAVYLTAQVNEPDATVGLGDEYVSIRRENDTRASAMVEQPRPVRAFRERFDSGRYPELIAESESVQS